MKRQKYKALRITKRFQILLSPINLMLAGFLLQTVWIIMVFLFDIFDGITNADLTTTIFVLSLLPASAIYGYGQLLSLDLKVGRLRQLLSYLTLWGIAAAISYWIAFIFSILVYQLS